VRENIPVGTVAQGSPQEPARTRDFREWRSNARLSAALADARAEGRAINCMVGHLTDVLSEEAVSRVASAVRVIDGALQWAASELTIPETG
jgi:hypothetical protein